MRKNALLILLMLCAIIFSGCGRITVDFTNPESVAQAFIQCQARNDRQTLKTLLTPDLQEKFEKEKLFLGERLELKKPKLMKQEIQKVWDESEKKIYQINYVVEYKTQEGEKKKSLREAIAVVKQGNSWYVEDYVAEK